MPKKIYNKNAREKALLEEAYTNVYKESAVDVELDHWWDFDEDEVVTFIYHSKQRKLPPSDPSKYEENKEKIFTWLEDKYPEPNNDPYEYDIQADPQGRREADPREF
jgi:hypothetical protein